MRELSDDSQSVTKNALRIMMSFVFGGPTFISKILPIANLNLKFLYEQIRLKTEAVIQSLSEVKANICDDNRNNQAKFILDCMIQNHSDHV